MRQLVMQSRQQQQQQRHQQQQGQQLMHQQQGMRLLLPLWRHKSSWCLMCTTCTLV
jgi:hypothetical protein